MAASSLVVSMIISSALVKRDRSMTAQAIYTAQFRAAAEISPGGDAAAGLPGTNTWCHDSRVFMEVTIPCFKREEVELEADVVAGDWVPVLTFTTASSWMLIWEEYSTAWRSVWMYGSPVDDGQQFTLLTLFLAHDQFPSKKRLVWTTQLWGNSMPQEQSS